MSLRNCFGLSQIFCRNICGNAAEQVVVGPIHAAAMLRLCLGTLLLILSPHVPALLGRRRGSIKLHCAAFEHHDGRMYQRSSILTCIWWSSKLTNPKTCCIVRETLQIAKYVRIIVVFWRIRHVTTNEWESRSRYFFWFVPDFLYKLFWRSCRAGSFLTQKLQISKCAWFFINTCKNREKWAYNRHNSMILTFDY